MSITWDKAEYDLAYGQLPAREPQPSTDPKLHPQYTIPVKLDYHRANVIAWNRPRLLACYASLGLTAADHVVLIGCGFGWDTEILEEYAPGIDAVGVDTGAYIQANKDGTETADVVAGMKVPPTHPRYNEWLAMLDDGGTRARTIVLDEDFKAAVARNRIRQALTGDPTWTITSDMIVGFTDQELTDSLHFLDDLARPQTPMTVAHLTTVQTPGHTPRVEFSHYNWKTLAEWRTFLDNISLSHHIVVDFETGTVG